MTDDEINNLKVGSVIKLNESGTMRVVRSVSLRRKPWPKTNLKIGDVHSVQVTIRHCSWTGGALTHLDRFTLRSMYSLVPVKPRRLRSKLDKTIKKEVVFGRGNICRFLTCCDVKGIA